MLKGSFFQAAVMSILPYGHNTWMLTKCMQKNFDRYDYTRIQQAVLNNSWVQRLTKQQLYGHLLPIMKAIKFRRIRHAGHCWSSENDS